MPAIKLAVKLVFFLLGTALITSCANPGNSTQNSSNSAQPSRTAPLISNVNKAAPAATAKASPAGGTIDVTSTPLGATVVLVREDEGSSGSPERKGATPVNITGVVPGKYTITLEKTGFKYFQKEVEVKENKTVRIAASLKRG